MHRFLAILATCFVAILPVNSRAEYNSPYYAPTAGVVENDYDPYDDGDTYDLEILGGGDDSNTTVYHTTAFQYDSASVAWFRAKANYGAGASYDSKGVYDSDWTNNVTFVRSETDSHVLYWNSSGPYAGDPHWAVGDAILWQKFFKYSYYVGGTLNSEVEYMGETIPLVYAINSEHGKGPLTCAGKWCTHEITARNF